LATRKLRERIDDRLVPLMGVVGAFIFAAQMITFSIPGTGSSGHLGVGLLLAIMLGPAAGFLVMASVLTVQAFFFADGGLLALGCNIWNLGIYPCFLAHPLLYQPLVRGSNSPGRIVASAVIAAVAGLQMGSLSVVLQTLLSGKSELPFNAFVLLMQPIHLAIGLVEGFVTAAVINYVRRARPELMDQQIVKAKKGAKSSLRKGLVFFATLAILTGGFFSWFASTNPDGLEWSIERLLGKADLQEQNGGLGRALKDVQDKTAFLPDYGFKSPDQSEAESKDAGSVNKAETSIAGIVGSLLVVILVMFAGAGIRYNRKKHS
jgi:cobalt/nickel transport system permease protein